MRMKGQHPCAGQQSCVQCKRRVLGRGPHQGDSAVFHHRQKRILLRAVEPVDFVHKQQSTLPAGPPHTGGLKDFFQIGHTGKNRRQRLKGQSGGARQQARHRRFAGAGRPPENQRTKRSRFDQTRQSAIGTDQMILPHHFA